MTHFFTISLSLRVWTTTVGTYKTLHRLDNVIKCAWDNGITHLDTAAFYENEQEIGDAIKRLNLPRDQLFITTKVGPESIIQFSSC